MQFSLLALLSASVLSSPFLGPAGAAIDSFATTAAAKVGGLFKGPFFTNMGQNVKTGLSSAGNAVKSGASAVGGVAGTGLKLAAGGAAVGVGIAGGEALIHSGSPHQ